MKIFWSWQSDTPGKIGRFVVRDALADAIEKLKQTPDIEEPTTREAREGMHLDHDVKNVRGSPDLARTILDKIDEARVVVADVTVVGGTHGKGVTAEKKLINSNVAIELGYAYRALGDENVILVFNTYYGAHEDLPFDLRHKGGAVVFDLPPDADKVRIKVEAKKLTAQFVSKLTPYLQAQPAAATSSIQETPSTYLKATYFNRREILAEIGEPEDLLEYLYDSDQLAYIRLIPTVALSAPIPLVDLKQAARQMPMLRRGHGEIVGHNQYGAIAYEPGSHPPKGWATLKASTQLFPNGEIWSISTEIIVADRGDRPAWVKVPFVHSLMFELLFYDTLHGLVAAAESKLALSPPWQIELGLAGTTGVNLVGISGREHWGPIRKAEVVHRMVLNGDTKNATDAILLRFFSQLYDATGYSRPGGLHGFPPSRPSEKPR